MMIRWKRWHAILALACLFAGARPAVAGPLAFAGTLTIRFVERLEETELTIPGAGVATVSGGPHLSSFLLSGGTFGPVTTVRPIFFDATFNELKLTGIENRSGSFTSAGGVMGMQGVAKLCLFFDASCNYVFLPISVAATGTPLVGFGIGGTQVRTGTLELTAQHAAWGLSLPTLTVHGPGTTVTAPPLPSGFIHGPASSSASSAAQPGGALQLVTASKSTTSLTGALPEYVTWGVLNLHFVPEPGMLALLAAGAAGLLAAGRGRR